jgi:hypothetical protein
MDRKMKKIVRFGLTIAALTMASGIAQMALANADPMTPGMIAYAARTASATCETFTKYPTASGFITLGEGIVADGDFSAIQAGHIMAYSVVHYCPAELPALERAMYSYSNQS